MTDRDPKNAASFHERARIEQPAGLDQTRSQDYPTAFAQQLQTMAMWLDEQGDCEAADDARDLAHAIGHYTAPFGEPGLCIAERPGKRDRIWANVSAELERRAAADPHAAEGCEVQRLDFSELPPGPPVAVVGWLTAAEHTAAAWLYYKARHDPPGMWSGFYGRLPDLKVYTPRMGVSLGIECHVAETEHDTPEGARSAGRAAAWEKYERASALVDSIDNNENVSLMFSIVAGRDLWPRCLSWPEPYLEGVERWIVASKEALRG